MKHEHFFFIQLVAMSLVLEEISVFDFEIRFFGLWFCSVEYFSNPHPLLVAWWRLVMSFIFSDIWKASEEYDCFGM
jgi:hypothetical protein